MCFVFQIEVVKILQELAESEPKPIPNIKGKDGQTYLQVGIKCSFFMQPYLIYMKNTATIEMVENGVNRPFYWLLSKYALISGIV